jgi:hypothetical protein
VRGGIYAFAFWWDGVAKMTAPKPMIAAAGSA